MSSAPALGVELRGDGYRAEPRIALSLPATAARHLLHVLPIARRELAHWRAAAASITDHELREVATASLRKQGNVEGAALFAALAPFPARRAAVRALVAYQTAYNYLDALSERPARDPEASNRCLHEALRRPFLAQGAHPDYYASSGRRGDGGYLASCVEVCRDALCSLPSRDAIAATATAAAERIVDFQSLNLKEHQGGHAGLRAWAITATPTGSGLHWWETAAGAGSSLAVHALIAAAATPSLTPEQALMIGDAYYPWAGALHSLLDSLVDRGEDADAGQRSLLGYYDFDGDAAERLATLARGASERTAGLADSSTHGVILVAMCSYYLSAPERDPAEAEAIATSLADVLGRRLPLALTLFRARRALTAIGRRAYV